jgi:hypothetical protein
MEALTNFQGRLSGRIVGGTEDSGENDLAKSAPRWLPNARVTLAITPYRTKE